MRSNNAFHSICNPFCPLITYSLGTFRLLLTIPHPHVKNNKLAGWNSQGRPSASTPHGNPSSPSCQPYHNHTAMIVSRQSVVGIGNPSKYLILPLLSLGSDAAVTLNRARRESPERRKNARMKVSSVVRKPSV